MLRADIDVSERALQRARRVHRVRTGTAEEPSHCAAAQLGGVRHLPARPRPVRGIKSLPTCHQTIELVIHFLLQQMRRAHLCGGFGQTNTAGLPPTPTLGVLSSTPYRLCVPGVSESVHSLQSGCVAKVLMGGPIFLCAEPIDFPGKPVYACGVVWYGSAPVAVRLGHERMQLFRQPKEKDYERLHDHRRRYPCHRNA